MGRENVIIHVTLPSIVYGVVFMLNKFGVGFCGLCLISWTKVYFHRAQLLGLPWIKSYGNLKGKIMIMDGSFIIRCFRWCESHKGVLIIPKLMNNGTWLVALQYGLYGRHVARNSLRA